MKQTVRQTDIHRSWLEVMRGETDSKTDIERRMVMRGDTLERSSGLNQQDFSPTNPLITIRPQGESTHHANLASSDLKKMVCV